MPNSALEPAFKGNTDSDDTYEPFLGKGMSIVKATVDGSSLPNHTDSALRLASNTRTNERQRGDGGIVIHRGDIWGGHVTKLALLSLDLETSRTVVRLVSRSGVSFLLTTTIPARFHARPSSSRSLHAPIAIVVEVDQGTVEGNQGTPTGNDWRRARPTSTPERLYVY
ncbi:hypothetical protein C8R46DRAFT_1235740 [Mycena filopes]|nr:hypothetical protein C8R46DRAFT_1235740 [Mycena filopes]